MTPIFCALIGQAGGGEKLESFLAHSVALSTFTSFTRIKSPFVGNLPTFGKSRVNSGKSAKTCRNGVHAAADNSSECSDKISSASGKNDRNSGEMPIKNGMQRAAARR